MKKPPYAATGCVLYESEMLGTCWLAGNNTAVTAAHVVKNDKMQVQLPGIGQHYIEVEDSIIHPDYRENKYDYDIALLRLRKAERRSLSLTDSFSDTVRMLGFPSTDKTMVESSGKAKQPNDEPLKHVLLHTADTEHGHSGGPVLATANVGGQQVIALHIWGFDLPNHPLHNVALVLRPELQGVRERPSSGLELIAGVRE